MDRPRHARRQFSNQFYRKPRCTTGGASSAHRHCSIRLACLPVRSILLSSSAAPLFLLYKMMARPSSRVHPTLRQAQGRQGGIASAHALGLGDVRMTLTRPICGIYEYFPLREHQDRLVSGFSCSQAESMSALAAHKPLTMPPIIRPPLNPNDCIRS